MEHIQKCFSGTHYVLGDYVLTAVPNAFNQGIGYWLSKRGCSAAQYCFTANTPKEVYYQMNNGMDAYIKLLESLLNGKSSFSEKMPSREAVSELAPIRHHDSYKVEQLRKMLAHETSVDEEHYGANLSHWHGDAKPLTIDAGGLRALIDYYSTHDTDLGNEE